MSMLNNTFINDRHFFEDIEGGEVNVCMDRKNYLIESTLQHLPHNMLTPHNSIVLL